MPNPISLDTFRQLAQTGSNDAIRIKSNNEVTTAPRRLGGRLIQQLFTGNERQGRLHIATELLRGLEAEYGTELARKAFQAVRSDLRAGTHDNEFVLGSKALTARQVRAILNNADGLRNEKEVSALRELSARYTPQAAIVRSLSERRNAALPNMTPAHWQVFSQLLTERLAEERVLTGATPTTQAADRVAGKLLAHVSRLSEDALLAGVEARQQMRGQGQDLLMALAGRPASKTPPSPSAPAHIGAFLNVTRNETPLTRDFLSGSMEELGKDGRLTLDRMALNLSINSMTPAFASELLSAMKAPGSEFRHLYAALNLLPTAAGATQRPGYTAACGEVGDLLDDVVENLARRAGEDPQAAAAEFQSLAEHARDADWAHVVQGPGFPSAQLKADGLASMGRVRDQIALIGPAVTQLAHHLAAAADQEVEETERLRRANRSDLCERLGNTLWEVSQAGNDACVVKGTGEVTPEIQAVLQEAGRELLHNPNVDLAQVVISLRRAGVVHGQGALEDFDLSYQALQDLTPFEQREQPLSLDHLKAQASLYHADQRVAESLLKDYMILAFNWADLHPEITGPNIRAKASTLHDELSKTRTGADRNPDFRQVIAAFERARIRMDREEFRPLTERLLALFPQT